MQSVRLGFIGLGTMGAPMARRALRAGYPLSVYNRTRAKVQAVAQAGARALDTPRGVAEESEVIIMMVTGPQALEAVLSGPDGIRSGLRQDATVINMSTVSYEATLAAAQAVERVGGRFLDAPVSGSQKPAEDGTLVILAGGSAEVLEDVRPVLECFGKTIIHCGEIGQGTRLKLVINLLLGGMLAAFAEALVFGRKLNLSFSDLLRAIEAGSLNAPMFRAKGAAIQAGDYTKTFSVDLLVKDLGLVLRAAEQAEMPLPLTEKARDLLHDTQRSGLGDEDIVAAVKFLAAITRVEL